MDKKKGLQIVELLELDPDKITIKDVKETDYENLKEFLELLDKEARLSIRIRCTYKGKKPAWLSIQRNLNPAYKECRPVILVWVTHYLKIAIKNIQSEALKEQEIEEVEKVDLLDKFNLVKA